MSLGINPYHLVKTYNASNFFNEFSYFNGIDPKAGAVTFLNHATAVASNLSYINDAGNVILKVDNSPIGTANQRRNSVRVSSTDTFGLGSLWVMDAYHVPYGCGVWGAYWSEGPTPPVFNGVDPGWLGGEIDIFEDINMQNSNQMTLHAPRCTMPDGLSQTGTPLRTDCTSSLSYPLGCEVTEANTMSSGKPFADAGGGVWVTQFDTSGIRIWFVLRSEVPDGGVPPDPSKLGTPSAFYSPSSCDPTSFRNQKIIFDITLCSTRVGYTSSAACPVQDSQSCYLTYVLGDGQGLNQAYFEIASLKIYAIGSDQGPAPQCTVYLSGPGDTCATIETAFGLSAGQVQEANPDLNCADIPVDTDICIPPPSSSTTSTSTTSTSTTTTSTTTSSTTTSSTTTSSTSNTTPTPSCLSTYISAPADTCHKLDKKYNLISGTIKQANQFLDCSNIWTWTPICIPDGPYNSLSCKSTYISVAGDTCSSIDAKYNLVHGTTKSANSFLTCTDIWTSTPICIPDGSYKPIACKTTYMSIAGDTCATIDNEFNLIDGTTKSANSFLTCSDIWTGTPICIPNGPYTTSHEPNCATEIYKSLAGETCSSIETKFALAAGSISSANTWVNCADIWTGTGLSICVPSLSHGDPMRCTKTISSAAGDTCSSIGQKYGTSAAWIKAWNSFLNCADIWEHTQVCVSHT